MDSTSSAASTSTPQQPSSVEKVVSNDDLLTQILVHLPLKSLVKCKSVSKRWLDLISSPHFSRIRNPNPVSGLFLGFYSAIDLLEYKFVPLEGDVRPSTPPSFSSLTSNDDPSGPRILQSCNGLLLCSSLKLGEDFKQLKYFIYNPTTQQSILLPELVDHVYHPVVAQQSALLPELVDHVYHPVVGVGIAFDPFKPLHYKIVCVRDYNSVMPDGYRIEIYSSESGFWRQSGDIFTAPDHKFNHGVFWNGAIHWINSSSTVGIGKGTILSFDVNEERFREMPMPEIPDDWNQARIRYFGESRNHLHLILLKGPCAARFNVYEMQKDYSRWFVKHQVDLDSVITTEFPEMRRSILNPENLVFYTFSILSLVRGENDEDSYLVLLISGILLGRSSLPCCLKRMQRDHVTKVKSKATAFWHVHFWKCDKWLRELSLV